MRLAVALSIWLLAAMPAAAQTSAAAAPAAETERARRVTAFRAFAQPFLGEWSCEIAEYDGRSETPIWSDRQRRLFALSMTRQFLEERAVLTTADGREYEGGLHLTTWDPNSDRIVQHGFWLGRQPDPLFRVEGRIAGAGFVGRMRIRNEDGGEAVRPLTIRWMSADVWLIEVTDTRPDGSIYLRERLTYTRPGPAAQPSPIPPPSAAPR